MKRRQSYSTPFIIEDSIHDALSSHEKELCDYMLENCREDDEDANDLLEKMEVYYDAYSTLARRKPNEVLRYFYKHIDIHDEDRPLGVGFTFDQKDLNKVKTAVRRFGGDALAEISKPNRSGVYHMYIDCTGFGSDEIREVKEFIKRLKESLYPEMSETDSFIEDTDPDLERMFRRAIIKKGKFYTFDKALLPKYQKRNFKWLASDGDHSFVVNYKGNEYYIYLNPTTGKLEIELN